MLPINQLEAQINTEGTGTGRRWTAGTEKEKEIWDRELQALKKYEEEQQARQIQTEKEKVFDKARLSFPAAGRGL